jgi:hypothetical protein
MSPPPSLCRPDREFIIHTARDQMTPNCWCFIEPRFDATHCKLWFLSGPNTWKGSGTSRSQTLSRLLFQDKIPRKRGTCVNPGACSE